MKIKEIPNNIGEYLEYDETSPSCLRWIKKFCNKINIGDIAGCLDKKNYYRTTFNGKTYLNHRIIFFLHHGFCPEIIDHIDCNKQNNRIENLREATKSENGFNRGKQQNNTTGIKGIFLHSSGKYQYWRVRITTNRNRIISKNFPLNKKQEACDYANKQRAKLHGNFANNGGN